MEGLSSAENVLKDFIGRMNEWEVKYYSLFRNDDSASHTQDAKEELDEIYSIFCTKKERKQGRQVALDCSDPPEYSPDEEVLSCDVSKNKIFFVTIQKTGFKNKFRYMLNFKEGRWLIDKKERFSFSENKWIKFNL
ncbi:NTF2 fold immunity protein [Pectobacterium parmentieri]|uniref:NTF2 fold immunity protein n=1 Tax=Pectobacterium parmentieri TaxID=1905730 RepID=UPI0004733823|nr:NTF2 fold immunity protein [Pectobacterium parmentieri]PWD64443.1 hypothetical protein DF211_07920 [Pectobacterium parmentieri]